MILKKETHLLANSDITNATNLENDLMKKVFDLYDINQYLTENNNANNNNENKSDDNENLLYYPNEIYKEILSKTSTDVTDSALKPNEVIELIIDLENNRYSAENSNKNSQELDQEIKSLERAVLYNKRKSTLLAKKTINQDLPNDSSSINEMTADSQQQGSNEYSTAKKSKFHMIETFNSYHSMSPASPSASPTSPGPRSLSKNYMSKSPLSIAEINPANFDHMNNYPQFGELNAGKHNDAEAKNQLDERESSFDSLDIEFENLVADNTNNQNLIHDHEPTETAESLLNNIEEVHPLSLANINNNSKHAKQQQHMNVDSSVKSSCPSSSPEGGGSSANYNISQMYYNNYSSSNANPNSGDNMQNISNMNYTESIYDRFTNLELKLDSTINFLTSFTNSFIKQLEMTRNEIKLLKNDLLGVTSSDRSNVSLINLNHPHNNHTNENHLEHAGLTINSNNMLDDADQNDNNQNSEHIGNFHGHYSHLESQTYEFHNREHQSNEIND